MSLSNPLKSAPSPLRAMDIQAFAPNDAPWDFGTHCTAISVNDTLLASRIPVAASATHPQKRTNSTIAFLGEDAPLPDIDPTLGGSHCRHGSGAVRLK